MDKYTYGQESENMVGEGENAGYQPFFLFPHCLQKASFLGSLKWETVWNV